MMLLELIGHTPIVKLRQFDTGKCELFVKLENQNPAGSLKDRIALFMIDDAEKSGKLKPGGTIVEATAGNTGAALALAAAQKGYKTLFVIPDKMSKEKINFLKAMGAEVVITRSDVNKGHPDYYQDLSKRIAAEKDNAYYMGQFENPSNPKAHEQTTGPEIWEQMKHDVDAIVCGVGTGGHITGIGHYMQKVAPHVEMILADPDGSILAHYIETGELITKNKSWMVEGMGEDYIPSICDLSVVKKAYTITDAEAFDTARDLLKKEAIFGGSSSGAVLCAALKYCREQTKPKKVVTFIYDSGNKYLSKMYNDEWMKENGFKV